jgi:hypothetical protein
MSRPSGWQTCVVIREDPVCNIDPDIGYPKIFLGFPQSVKKIPG